MSCCNRRVFDQMRLRAGWHALDRRIAELVTVAGGDW